MVGGGAPVFTADQLVPLFNGYVISGTSPNDWEIRIPHASELVDLEEITLKGTLLPKELTAIRSNSAKRDVRLAGGYTIEAGDGDLHFCVGTPGSPSSAGHIGCELQRATGWLPFFQQGLNKPITVTGYFRCLFEHPGFQTKADAHIFEIHPVRAVDPLNGKPQVFDVDAPIPAGIRQWEGTHVPCNEWDDAMKVTYDKGTDTLVFRGMHGMDKNYVQIQGKVNNARIPSPTQSARFTFTSKETTKPHEVICLPGSSAFHQLESLKSQPGTVWLVALRNIDLKEAINNSYRINLLAIDIRSEAQGPAVTLAQLGSEI